MRSEMDRRGASTKYPKGSGKESSVEERTAPWRALPHWNEVQDGKKTRTPYYRTAKARIVGNQGLQ